MAAVRFDSIDEARLALGERASEVLGEQQSAATTAPAVTPKVTKLNPLATIIAQARRNGGLCIRNGVASLQFNLAAGKYALVELLPDATHVSVYSSGKLMQQKSFPALSAYELMRLLPVDSIMMS